MKIQERYSAFEFENKIFPWALVLMVILAGAYIWACVVNPWMILLIPLCAIGVIFIGTLIFGGAIKITEAVRAGVEVFSGEDFKCGS